MSPRLSPAHGSEGRREAGVYATEAHRGRILPAGTCPGIQARPRPREAFHKAAGLKEVRRIDGASHVHTYNKGQYVDPAVDKLVGFFTDNVGKTA